MLHHPGGHDEDYATTARTKAVECLDLTQNEDVPYASVQWVQKKGATATYPTSEKALEAVLKKRLREVSRAARYNKRHKGSAIDLT